MHEGVNGADKSARNKASDMDANKQSSKSYSPGYSYDKSIPGATVNDVKTGFKKGE